MNSIPGLFLAIDQSTSATKAILFTTGGHLLDQESLNHLQIYPRSGWVEHDAEEIFENTIKVAGNLLQRHQEKINKLIAINLTNQRETFVLFDRKTGLPKHNAIVWQCVRGAELCQELINRGHEAYVMEHTGLKIDTYFPASKLAVLFDDRPDLRKGVKDGSMLFGTMDTYLIYRLTGGRIYASDYTNASRTLLFDIDTLSWSQDLCNIFGLEFFELPDLQESRAWFGDTELGGLLPRRIPICGVIGDSQAALFAQRCYNRGDAKVTFGTGSSLLLNIGEQKYISKSGSVTTIGWVINGRPTYALEGITNFTGGTIAWLRDQLQLISKSEESELLATSIPDNGGVYLVPAFAGLSAPYWRPDVRAAILGLTAASTKAHIARAALESIAYIVNDVLQQMSSDANVKMQYIHADGGASQNRFLMQFVADLSQLRVKVARLHELSALGAVLCGMLGMGVKTSFADLRQIHIDSIEYTPKRDEKMVTQLLEGWRNAVNQVLHK